MPWNVLLGDHAKHKYHKLICTSHADRHPKTLLNVNQITPYIYRFIWVLDVYIYIFIYIYIVHLESVLPSMFAYGTHKRIKTKVTKCNSEITGIKK